MQKRTMSISECFVSTNFVTLSPYAFRYPITKSVKMVTKCGSTVQRILSPKTECGDNVDKMQRSHLL